MHVDVVDDGEVLSTLGQSSVDFVIANHMIEHCQNPIGTIKNHLRILKRNGILFYAIPDKNQCFDKQRPCTSFNHLLEDYKDGGIGSKFEHYMEWAVYVNSIKDDVEARRNAEANIRSDYSIHFHVWDANSCINFFSDTASFLGGAFGVELFERNDTEFVLCLRKLT